MSRRRTWAEIRAEGAISAAEMERFGVERRDFHVVRFLDSNTEVRWFMREHETVGTINVACNDEGTPIDRSEVMGFVREHFGKGCRIVLTEVG